MVVLWLCCEQKVLPVLHDYVRHLLLDRLTPATIEDVLKIIRKLPWTADPNVQGARCALGDCTRGYVLHWNAVGPGVCAVPLSLLPGAVFTVYVRQTLLKLTRVYFEGVHLAASLIAGLREYHQPMVGFIVDAVCVDLPCFF